LKKINAVLLVPDVHQIVIRVAIAAKDQRARLAIQLQGLQGFDAPYHLPVVTLQASIS